MRPGQRVTGEFQVVKLCVEPTVHGVAGLTGSGKTQADVVDNRCKKILLMAGVTGRRQSLELSAGGALVTFFALHQRMRSY